MERSILFVLSSLLCGCCPAPVVRAAAPVAAPAAVPATPAAPPTVYAGHGEGSVPPEVLARYRAAPLEPEVSRRIQRMLDLRGPGTGMVSPDGKRLFFTWNVTGVAQVWRIDGPQRFPVQLTGGEDATRLVGLTPDGKWVVVSRDRKGEEYPGLYLLAPDGGPLVLVQHQPKVRTIYQDCSPDGRYLYFKANDLRPDAEAIYRYDLVERRREAVITEPGLWSLADRRDDGRLLLRKATGSLSAEIFEWDPTARALTPVIGQDEKEEHEVAYGGRGEILVLTNKLGEFRRLYALAGGKLTPVTDERPHDVSSFRLDRRRTRLFVETNEDGYTRLRALDARTYKPLALPPLPESDHLFAVATTPDGRFTTVGLDDGRQPLQAFVIDWQRGVAEAWHLPSAPEVDTRQFVRATLERYPARDGTPIPVLVRAPPACAGRPCPVIVQFHGGPEGQATPGFNTWAQIFVDAGFVFVEPNVRGSDGYGKTWLRADDGPRRLQVITDIEDAARWARQRFTVDGKAPRLGVFGGSYGGYSTLVAMSMFAGAYDAGVSIVGISNLVTFLKNTAPYRRLLRVTEYGDPEGNRDALIQLSPITHVDKIKAPLLIIQGATDPRVPAGEAIQMHEALAARGVTSPLVIFPDEGHGAQKRENRVLMIGHSLAFFLAHLR